MMSKLVHIVRGCILCDFSKEQSPFYNLKEVLCFDELTNQRGMIQTNQMCMRENIPTERHFHTFENDTGCISYAKKHEVGI